VSVTLFYTPNPAEIPMSPRRFLATPEIADQFIESSDHRVVESSEKQPKGLALMNTAAPGSDPAGQVIKVVVLAKAVQIVS
jgi:hypothetical protein